MWYTYEELPGFKTSSDITLNNKHRSKARVKNIPVRAQKNSQHCEQAHTLLSCHKTRGGRGGGVTHDTNGQEERTSPPLEGNATQKESTAIRTEFS